MKFLISLLLTCSSVLGQGFGSFSYDQPFLANNASSKASFTPYLQNGLVAYWRLDEVTTNGVLVPLFHDSSDPFFDANNKLTKNNTTMPVTQVGIITNSILLDGDSASGASCPDNPYLSWRSNITVTAWIYETNNAGGNAYILNKNNSSPISTYEYGMQRSSADQAQFIAYASGGQATATAVSPAIALNNWLFVAGQINNGDKTVRIRTATTSSMGQWYSTGYSGNPVDATGPFRIGGNSLAVTFRGRIDEVTFWTNIISDSDITNLWNRTAPFN